MDTGNLYRNTTPHAGFFKLIKLAKEKCGGYFVFTSNVDGQFQKASFDNDIIEECHGSIHHFQCSEYCNSAIWSADDIDVYVDEEEFIAREPLPVCAKFGSIARPNILMFGDWSWNSLRTLAQSERFTDWFDKLQKKYFKLVIVELGAGLVVPTVRSFSDNIASRGNATLIRINPRDYDVARENHIALPFGSLEGILKIC